MTLFAGELLEVAPKDPASVAVVGGYIVVPDANLVFGGGAGLMPNGSFAVLDLSTESAQTRVVGAADSSPLDVTVVASEFVGATTRQAFNVPAGTVRFVDCEAP